MAVGRSSAAGWLGSLAALLVVVSGPVAGEEVPPRTGPAVRIVSAADLQADLALLRQALEALHPGLYRYRSKADLDAAFDRVAREFARDQSLAAAYLAFSRLATDVQCGHTYANFFNQGDEVKRAVLDAPRLPFEFRWLDGHMVVTRSLAPASRLRPGSEVLAIDGRPVGEILAALLPYSRADGGNDAKRISNLEVQGRGRYEAYDVFFPLLYPRAATAPFTLQVRVAPGAAVEDLVVPAIAASDRPVLDGSPRGDTNPWQARELAPGIAYLRMPTWALYNSTFDWQTWLTGWFRGLVESGARDLIIDLRGNEGGSNVGDHILAHLVATDLPTEPVLRKTRYRKVPEALAPFLDTWDRSFFDWGDGAVDLGDGFYRLKRYDDEPGGRFIAPVAPRFTGRVWVLVGAANSSATFEFASAVQRRRLGTLVGQPTGGNQRGITGGAFFFMRLPKTGIEVDLPLIGQFPVSAALPPDAGLEPDVLVHTTIEHIASGRDAELEAVLARIGAPSG